MLIFLQLLTSYGGLFNLTKVRLIACALQQVELACFSK